MYTQFIQTNDDGYSLKSQGVASTIIVGGVFLAIAAYLFMSYFKDMSDRIVLYLALGTLFCAFVIFLRSTRKFIIYPKQKRMKHSPNLFVGMKEFKFEEYEGPTIVNVKSGVFTVGKTLNLSFNRDGKRKAIM